MKPIALSIILLISTSCGDDSKSTAYPYEPGETTIIGGIQSGGGSSGADGGSSSGDVDTTAVSTFATGTPSGNDCIAFDEGCVQPQEQCGEDATADVIVGANGEVLSVICYPNKNYDVQEIGDQVENPRLPNNTVIVLDDENDGDDVVGDLVVEGNNVIVYGDGPDNSVIGGNLDIEKNNAIVRGVRIRGNVSITKNNASLIYCVIEGDLTITGNNVNLALCEIWGNVSIEGNNAVFVSNLVQGEQPISGVNLHCNDNYRFGDLNDDGVVDEDEVGEPIVCESRDDAVADDPNLEPGIR
jgi:hypothetical protein